MWLLLLAFTLLKKTNAVRESWRWLFFIEGLVTLLIGVVSFFKMLASVVRRPSSVNRCGTQTAKRRSLSARSQVIIQPRVTWTIANLWDPKISWRYWWIPISGPFISCAYWATLDRLQLARIWRWHSKNRGSIPSRQMPSPFPATLCPYLQCCWLDICVMCWVRGQWR